MAPRFVPICTNSPQSSGTQNEEGNNASTVSNHGCIVSIRSSTMVNCSAVVMNRNGSVDDSCRHCIDAVFSFFLSRCTPILLSGSNRDESWPES